MNIQAQSNEDVEALKAGRGLLLSFWGETQGRIDTEGQELRESEKVLHARLGLVIDEMDLAIDEWEQEHRERKGPPK